MNAIPLSSGPDEGDPGLERSTPTLVESMTSAELVTRAVSDWRSSLAMRAGASSLADIALLGDAMLDLSAAHPSGVAQLFAGRPTQLANLFREGASLPTARRRARSVGIRAKEHAERYGIAPTYLAIGIATWTEDAPSTLAGTDVAALARVAGGSGAALNVEMPELDDGESEPFERPRRVVRAPVLLRPIRVAARGSGESDYELTLETTAELNPVLSRALRSRGALLDPEALARGAFVGGGFDPRAATERVHALGTAVLADFELVEKLIVGTFVHPGQLLVDDVDELSGLEHHEVLTALARLINDPDDVTMLGDGLPAADHGDQDPSEERGVGDLDPAQRHLLKAIDTGSHIFADAPAGADVAGSVAAVIADAAVDGRSVLYVPGHRRAAEGVIASVEKLGLGDLLLDVPPDQGWRSEVSARLLSAMTQEAPPVDHTGLERDRADLLDTRRRLSGYIESLHLVREPWGVSAYDALQGLARLTAERPAPATRVRLDRATTAKIDGESRDQFADDLAYAAELGAFTLRAPSTPWFGADLTTSAAAATAHGAAEKLAGSLLPELTAHIDRVRASSGLVEPATLRAFGEQLTMLSGMRTTLDVFQPMIFERTAADLVAATAPKKWRTANDIAMGRLHRRRLRRQAKDMVRPGVRVADLHSALIEVQEQRVVWQDHCPGGGWPRLPEGLARVEQTYEQVLTQLTILEPSLVTTPAGGDLLDVDLPTLLDRMEQLANDREALDTLPERTTTLARLRAEGLGVLLDDLSNRRVAMGLVRSELELAWWSSVFEQILSTDPYLAVYDGASLEELAGRFRELDRQQVRNLQEPTLAMALSNLSRAMRNSPKDTEELFAELIEGRFASVRDIFERFPAVARTLRPAIIATPTLVPHLLPATRTVDLVILDSVQHVPLEVLVSAIARGRQILVIGDSRCASADAVSSLNRVLPSVALRAQVSSRDQQFVDFLVRHGYEGVLRPTPLPEAHELIGFDVVPGTGMPDQESGTVLTTQLEVDRVVELAITHALTRPEESLAVVSVSELHADRIREALLAEVRHNPALSAYFDPAKPESVVIADLSGVAGLSRDAVILSVGFGRTPHGRVLHRFGLVSQDSGRAFLLDALGVSRSRLHVVSAFSYEDLDQERLRTPGAQLLGDLLQFAQQRAVDGPAPKLNDGMETDLNPDRLVIDLAERLWSAGLLVETDFGISGGDRIPLVVGHPEFPDRMLVAVLTDDDAYVAEPSIRVRDRQISERLEVLGWTVVQVWSAAAFLDPVKEANRVRQVVLGLAEQMRADPLVTAPAVPETPDFADDDDVDAVFSDGVADVLISGPGAVENQSYAPGDFDQAPQRSQRPDVQPGLPISAYGDNQIDALAQWVRSDGIDRDAHQLAGALRAELGVVRRSNRVDTVIDGAVRRALGSTEQ